MKERNDKRYKKGSKNKKFQVYKPRKKKSAEEDAAIQYLQAQYVKIVSDDVKTFKDFPLSQKTLKGLKENNYIVPTEIQKQAIGYALQGKDILGAAKTGSGKTLAFLIPILENLFCKKWTRLDGVGALVISPTRELAYQIYETLRKVGFLHDFSVGLIIGGQNLKFERKRMDQINILISTPGRLLQHMDENPLFSCHNLQILVLDEADRCLDMGFEATMNAIIENLPPERQTLLFSATQTKSVKDLARLSLSFPTYVAPHEQAETVTPEFLQQSYIICEIHEKIGILWSFIKNHLKQKVLVFMATCKQVKYTYDLFCKLRPGVSLLALYGTLHQEKREKIYNEFCRKSNVVLFATDLASRGLDFPRVNWVIQMDCPEDVDTYIHRAGRTARGVFGKGEGLLMLLPNEEKIIEKLRNKKIPINKIAVDPSKVIAPQKKIEVLLSDHMDLKQTAQRAFVNYLKSVFLMKDKEIFDVKLIDTDAYARSLGLLVPPTVKFLQKYQKKDTNVKKESAEIDGHNVIEKLIEKSETEESDQSASKEEDYEKLLPEPIKTEPQNNIEIPKLDYQNFEVSDNDELLHTKEANVDAPLKDEPQTKKKISKSLTKAAAVKMILKKKIKVNSTVKFTELDEVMEDEQKDFKSDFGLHIAKTKDILQKEDKRDKPCFKEKAKAMQKEKKRKLKTKKKRDVGDKDDFGSLSESDGPDLSWLPDPDKVYGSKGSDNESLSGDNNRDSMQSDDQQCEESEDEQVYHRPSKRKLIESRGIPQEGLVPCKVKKIEDLSSKLSVHEAEMIAISLLKKKP
ncbi:unnamed protein product [Diatraea saccharalis]|uniref:ATP-dependent RNA helicase n=1 Tax=Diatraea saccharalis TaxID=40085 RepID=A0A9N9R2E1_9NEOP|nr:unnamed protein product [Diatraea saccharalis]